MKDGADASMSLIGDICADFAGFADFDDRRTADRAEFYWHATQPMFILGQMKDALQPAIIYAPIPHYHWFVTLKSHNGLIDLK